MNRHIRTALCLVVLFWATSALAQTTTSDSGTGTTAADTSTPTNLSIKQLLASEKTMLIVDVIHGIFQEIRSTLGMDATSTTSSTDLLSMLESALIESVSASATPTTSAGS